MIDKSRRKRNKFYVPIAHSPVAQPSRIRHSAFTNTAGKVSVRNSCVTVAQNPSTSEDIHCASPLSFDNYDININDQSNLIPLDNVGVSVGRRRTQVCTHNSIYVLLSYISQDEPLLTWLHDRDKYLAELIMMEGRGDALRQERCIQCLDNPAEFRCFDCFGQELFCRSCMISNHTRTPFHVVNVWSVSLDLSICKLIYYF
jgi:hypothetical protein